MLTEFNKQSETFHQTHKGLLRSDLEMAVEKFIDTDPKKISWSRALKGHLRKDRRFVLDSKAMRIGHYRPYCTSNLYFDRILSEYVHLLHRVFPTPNHDNLLILADSRGSTKPFSSLITSTTPDFELISKGQGFPLYLYEKDEPRPGELLREESEGELIDGYRRRHAITDGILAEFRKTYGKDVSKDDIFYYVYGILHSPEYRTRFASDLKKMLPRIPLTQETADYKKFTQAGRDLAGWHLNYETSEPWPLAEISPELGLDPWKQYHVSKMTFAKPTATQKAAGQKQDKTTIHYNSHLTLTGIPLEAYDYIVNGKPALEWIMERYQFSRDKASGITNDPNDWCKEHDQPRYIVDLIKRVTRVSLETMKIVNGLPALNERK